jgi:hypothetical protein
MKHLLKLLDLSQAEIKDDFGFGGQAEAGQQGRAGHHLLKGRPLA